MGAKSKHHDPPMYYEESSHTERKRRFYLKPVKLIETKAAKNADYVNIQVTRGSKNNINIDKVEEKKICEHVDFVMTKLQKLHKSVMWNMYFGRSFLYNIELSQKIQEETNLSDSYNEVFDIHNAKTWSKECFNHIDNTLRVNEIPNDGLVCLFSVANDHSEYDADSDEVAWEIEKVAVYHSVINYGQRLLNQEGVMARQGLDPISRKVRTPGRNRSGYVVYLAYQLVDSITFSQVMVETVLYGVDIEQKKKQILNQLGDLKMSPPVDDRNRKVINDVKEFMGKEQVEILHQLKDIKDVKKLSVISQFIQLLHLGGSQQGGMAGLNQFVTFLSQKEQINSSSSRHSLSRGSRAGHSSTMLQGSAARTRKQSTSSLSSCSPTPETPHSSSATSRPSPSPRPAPVRKPSGRKSVTESRRLSSLGDIQSDQESEASGQETPEDTASQASSVQRRVRSKNFAGRHRRPVSMQETTGTPVRNRNKQSTRAI